MLSLSIQTSSCTDEETCSEEIPLSWRLDGGYAGIKGKSKRQEGHGDHGQDTDGSQSVSQITHNRAKDKLC